MIFYTVPYVLLKAAVMCAAKKDVRWYLQGVALNRGHVVATDGHRMFYAPCKGIKESDDCIIPSEAIKELAKAVGRTRELDKKVVITINGNEGTLRVEDAIVYFNPTNARYPDWHRVKARESVDPVKYTTVCFNWEYMHDFKKIAQVLGDKVGTVYLKPAAETQTAGASVLFPNSKYEAYGTVMPMRTGEHFEQ